MKAVAQQWRKRAQPDPKNLPVIASLMAPTLESHPLAIGTYSYSLIYK